MRQEYRKHEADSFIGCFEVIGEGLRDFLRGKSVVGPKRTCRFKWWKAANPSHDRVEIAIRHLGEIDLALHLLY